MTIKLLSCISLKYDTSLIPHFCNHYCKYNIDHFHFILHNDKKFKIYDFLHYFSPITKLKITFTQWVGEFNAIDKILKFNEIIDKSKQTHILLSDIDEFQQHKTSINTPYVWGALFDRFPKDNQIKKVTNKNLEQQFPIIGPPSWENNIKPCVFPKTDKLLSSHHITCPYSNESTIRVDHYRWTDTRLDKSKERLNIYTRLNRMKKTFPMGNPLVLNDSINIIKKIETKNTI